MKSTTLLLSCCSMFLFAVASGEEFFKSMQQQQQQQQSETGGLKYCLSAYKCARNCLMGNYYDVVRSSDEPSEVSTTSKVICLMQCRGDTLKCFDLPETSYNYNSNKSLSTRAAGVPTTFASSESDRIDFIFRTTPSYKFKVQNAVVGKGKFYKEYPNKIETSEVNQITFDGVHNVVFGACGFGEGEIVGAEGSFQIFHSNNDIHCSTIKFKAPHGEPNNLELVIKNNQNSEYSCRQESKNGSYFSILCAKKTFLAN